MKTNNKLLPLGALFVLTALAQSPLKAMEEGKEDVTTNSQDKRDFALHVVLANWKKAVVDASSAKQLTNEQHAIIQVLETLVEAITTMQQSCSKIKDQALALLEGQGLNPRIKNTLENLSLPNNIKILIRQVEQINRSLRNEASKSLYKQLSTDELKATIQLTIELLTTTNDQVGESAQKTIEDCLTLLAAIQQNDTLWAGAFDNLDKLNDVIGTIKEAKFEGEQADTDAIKELFYSSTRKMVVSIAQQKLNLLQIDQVITVLTGTAESMQEEHYEIFSKEVGLPIAIELIKQTLNNAGDNEATMTILKITSISDIKSIKLPETLVNTGLLLKLLELCNKIQTVTITSQTNIEQIIQHIKLIDSLVPKLNNNEEENNEDTDDYIEPLMQPVCERFKSLIDDIAIANKSVNITTEKENIVILYSLINSVEKKFGIQQSQLPEQKDLVQMHQNTVEETFAIGHASNAIVKLINKMKNLPAFLPNIGISAGALGTKIALLEAMTTSLNLAQAKALNLTELENNVQYVYDNLTNPEIAGIQLQILEATLQSIINLLTDKSAQPV